MIFEIFRKNEIFPLTLTFSVFEVSHFGHMIIKFRLELMNDHLLKSFKVFIHLVSHNLRTILSQRILEIK